MALDIKSCFRSLLFFVQGPAVEHEFVVDADVSRSLDRSFLNVDHALFFISRSFEFVTAVFVCR